MKSRLVKLNAKDYETEIKGKKVYQVAGSYFCKKCGYEMTPQVKKVKKGFGTTIAVFLDMACLCEQPR